MRSSTLILAASSSLLPYTLARPFEQDVGFDKETRAVDYSRDRSRAKAVKEAFAYGWAGYSKYAFPHDELHPITNGYSDSRNGWGASAVDALSTAIIMESPEIVDQILNHIAQVDYTKTNSQVSLFETTIRYVGGMLAGYDLLKGPFSHLTTNANVDKLLTQTKILADTLKFAFDTPTGIPANNLNITAKTTDASSTNGLATIGTLVLEYTHLSDLLGDNEYAIMSQRGESYLLNPKPIPFAEPFPGLLGTDISIATGDFIDNYGSWGAESDSFYEYLIKMYVYDSRRFAHYKDRWVAAADSSIANLASHPSSRPDLTFMAGWQGQNLSFDSQHLACFDGGNFLLAGSVLGEQKYVDFGLALVNGCHDTYASTLTGIGPEAFAWAVSGAASSVPAAQAAFYAKAGFYVTSNAYVLRPEVMESFYYAYRITGDSMYKDWAWNAFVAINNTCRAGSGFAGLQDVNQAGGGGYIDFQESFFFAELMKYSYMIHAGDAEWQVDSDGNNQWVFNTEAHPFKVAYVT